MSEKKHHVARGRRVFFVAEDPGWPRSAFGAIHLASLVLAKPPFAEMNIYIYITHNVPLLVLKGIHHYWIFFFFKQNLKMEEKNEKPSLEG